MTQKVIRYRLFIKYLKSGNYKINPQSYTKECKIRD
jgi:hypothetical protein